MSVLYKFAVPFLVVGALTLGVGFPVFAADGSVEFTSTAQSALEGFAPPKVEHVSPAPLIVGLVAMFAAVGVLGALGRRSD